MKNNCRAVREQDEYVCHRCGYRWDIKDPQPPRCKTKREIGLDRIGEIRNKYGLHRG